MDERNTYCQRLQIGYQCMMQETSHVRSGMIDRNGMQDIY
jgi:hypothetical protein